MGVAALTASQLEVAALAAPQLEVAALATFDSIDGSLASLIGMQIELDVRVAEAQADYQECSALGWAEHKRAASRASEMQPAEVMRAVESAHTGDEKVAAQGAITQVTGMATVLIQDTALVNSQTVV